MDELGLTRLHEVPAGFFLSPDGRPMPRPAADALQLAVSPAPEDVGDFQVNVFINGVDMAARRGGLGLDPSSVLVPNNEFIATETPHTIAISRCGCGIEGCNDIEATIVRDGDVVHWEWNWLTEPPMPRGVTFDAAAYDAEVARFAADTSWETPERTAARLIWRDADHDALARRGLRCYWFGNDYRDASRFDIGLRYRDSHQVFLKAAWGDRTPEQLAEAVIFGLSTPPETWTAQWYAMLPGTPSAPDIAGPRWSPYRH